jgi:hypothetical protein
MLSVSEASLSSKYGDPSCRQDDKIIPNTKSQDDFIIKFADFQNK